ncbi:nicotinate phosphoribosyltransferase [Pigmentiphaga litoralis]|uniref:nicotinate phosphoribosyltransferase n=1 Tax=Pigmentiphaga litoralis TaxID=516702 RepID=UPI003B4353DB
MTQLNPLTQIDFYKSGHIFQYPEGTESVYSNFTARSDRLAPVLRSGLAPFEGKVVFVGLQGFIKEFLIDTFNKGFFDIPKDRAVRQYQRRMDTALGAGAVPVDHIAALHDLGYLPIRVKALPEGSRVDIKVPLFTVRETRKEFAWLTNYLETVFSSFNWKPITVATIAYEYRRLLEAYADATGADASFVDWQAHDFSARGLSGPEDSMRASFAHLVSFTGTDTVAAIDYAEAYYGADADKELIGGSVPATEHSVMSMGGQLDELATFRRLVTEVYPSGIVSIVSDTWDFWQVITEYALMLKAEILERRPNALGQAKVVFRPDSGDPVKILTGYADHELVCGVDGQPARSADGRYQVRSDDGAGTALAAALPQGRGATWITEAERKGAVECLWDIFGGTLTGKGFRVLNERVGLIYGDSITLKRAELILERLRNKGFASTNCVFGVGSYSYQYLTRDSFGMAMKATWGKVKGKARELSKDPKTDNGVKKSAVGLLRVERQGGDYVLFDRQTEAQENQGLLQDAFVDGKLVREHTLAQIRERLRNGG